MSNCGALMAKVLLTRTRLPVVLLYLLAWGLRLDLLNHYCDLAVENQIHLNYYQLALAGLIGKTIAPGIARMDPSTP